MNPPDLLVAVSAYAGDLPQVERLLPHYLAHGAAVLILSPADAPIHRVSDPCVHCQWVGEAEWAGPKSLIRHKLFLKQLLSFTNKNWFLFNDSDSVVLSPQLPEYLFQEKASWANLVQDMNPGKSYLPKVAAQPPYFFHRDVLESMYRIAESGHIPTSYYGEVTGDPLVTSCIDHYHMQLSYGTGFPMKSFPDGVSFNTKTPEEMDAMASWVSAGKIFLHSIKTKESLGRMVRERNRRAS